MSRYTFPCASNPDHTFSFGFDHALGYFYDIYDEQLDVMVEEKSSMFDRLTGIHLAIKIQENISENMKNRYSSCISRMQLDLDF